MMTQRPSRDNGGDYANARRKDEPHQQKPERLILGSERRRATQSLPIGGERAHSSVIIFHSSIIAQSAREPIAIACNCCVRAGLSRAIASLVFECALAKGRSRWDACRVTGGACCYSGPYWGPRGIRMLAGRTPITR